MDFDGLRSSRESGSPIYLQLYRRFREAIEAGQLLPGDRVPAVRSLASELNIARGTVETAYQMLVSEGYFVARGAAGTVVSPRLGTLTESGHARAAVPVLSLSPRPLTVTGDDVPFKLGLPALDAFPRKTWARLAGRSVRALETAAMIAPDPAGYEPLRRAIATYLGISRGIVCSHEQVFVTTGYRGALELVYRTLLKSGDIGWYEEPGYIFARQCLQHLGLRLMPVTVDHEGLSVAVGKRRADQARFVVVTPTHQSPMGMALSLPRRLELLDWANRRRAWIIEDDYDSEFRYHGRPLPALKSLDRDGRVLYTGTFSKVLFPGLRLAYVVVPVSQVERFRERVEHMPGPGSILPQAMVADFIEQGHFARHLRRMRSLYAERRAYMVDALEHTLGDGVHVEPQAGGIQVLAHLRHAQDDKRIASEAEAQGLAVQALSQWCMRKSSLSGLIMGFANFADADEAMAAVRQLGAVLAAR